MRSSHLEGLLHQLLEGGDRLLGDFFLFWALHVQNICLELEGVRFVRLVALAGGSAFLLVLLGLVLNQDHGGALV